MPKLHVEVVFWNGEFQKVGGRGRGIPPSRVVKKSWATTDSDGNVLVDVPDPVPDHVSLNIRPQELRDPGTPSFTPRELLVAGVVVPYKHAQNASKVKQSPKPGEIIVLGQRLSALDRMRQEVP